LNLSRTLTNRLFHLAQNDASKEMSGIIGAADGVARVCLTLKSGEGTGVSELLQQLEFQGLKPFATFSLSQDLTNTPARPEALALPSLPHLVIGQRTQGVLEIDAYIDTPEGWMPIEVRLPEH
jgi:hypothetical protein